MLNKVQNLEVSDTENVDSSTTDCSILKISVFNEF